MDTSLKLRELREEKKIKQKDLAEIMNVSPNTVSYWEQGKREPNFDDLKKLADIFDVSLDYLLGRDNSKCANLSNEQKKLLNDFEELNKSNQEIILSTIAAFLTQQAARVFGNVINSNGGDVRNCFNSGNNCVMS